MIPKPLIIANWKMNPRTPKEAERLFAASAAIADRYRRHVDLVVCPPFIYLPFANQNMSKYRVGAQDCFWENPARGGGAYTGEVSATMLKQNGARLVIVGHSERREYFGETNAVVAKKMAVALASGLKPVLCVGERERNDAPFLSFIKQEVVEGLSLVKKPQIPRVIIAYEPIWAIGTNERPIAPKQVFEINLYIKKVLYGIWGKRVSAIRLIYGGSVAPGYTASFLSEGGMTGLLVGHQSLNPKNLEKMVYEITNI